MKLAVIGTSDISRQFIVGALEAGFTLAALCSRSAEKGADFLTRCKAGTGKSGIAETRVFTDIAAMSACPDVDVVYLATPPALHFEHALAVINAGKHVLVEKPCFSSVAQVKFAIEAARQKNVFLLETMRLFYSPLTEKLISALPMIGPVRYVSLNYMRYSSKYDDYKRGIVHPSFSGEMGGGALSDLCVYAVYLALILFGKPNRVQYAGVPLICGADGIATLLLSYPGFNCVINGCKLSTAQTPSEIQGENGSLLIDNPFMRAGIHFQSNEAKTDKKELFRQDFNDMVTQQKALHDIIAAHDTERLSRAHRFMLDSTAILDQCRAAI
ncbi:MAG: Gfo/Idh/MocA family oxidoreductase [Spirochaetaceae bacterium]|jgi:predicted dehydrogenase|nr:Gfo/Idh/MocA family oxidoreductase [Spirochaetaceae bacterium]